jgi:DNA-binding beta-propeller fold protein YncE
VDDVIATAMAKSPDRRFSSGRELGAALRAAIGPGPTQAPTRVRLPKARRRRRVLVGGAAAAVLAAVLVTILVLAGGGGAKKATQTGGVPVRVDSVIKLDPNTLKPVADIKVGNTPQPIVFSGGVLWVVNSDDGTISQIDPRTTRVLATRGGVASPCDIDPDGHGSVWIHNCSGDGKTWSHLDPNDLSEDGTLTTPRSGTGALVAHGRSIWVGTSDGATLTPDYVYEFRQGSSRPIGRVRVGSSPGFLTYGGGAVWSSNFDQGTVSKIDPHTDRVTQTISGWTGPCAMGVGFGAVWLTDCEENTVTKLDVLSGRVDAKIPGLAGFFAFGPDAVWAVNPFSEDVWRIDPDTGRVEKHVVLPYGDSVAYADGYVWITGPAD